MAIIQHLVAVKPLNSSAGNCAYNIYKDPYKTQCINYIQLSSNIKDLGLGQQPLGEKQHPLCGQPRILYFNQDQEMKWDWL